MLSSRPGNGRGSKDEISKIENETKRKPNRCTKKSFVCLDRNTLW